MLRALAAVVVVACGSTASPPSPPIANAAPSRPSDPFEAHVAAFRAFKDAICACKDNDCMNQVTAEIAQWKQVEPNNAGPRPDDDHKRLDVIDAAFDRCLHAFELTQPPDGSF